MHLPLKVAMHAVNPVQRLRLLRARLERQTAETMDPEWIFHAQMSSIFHSVRDLHTNYLLPAPFAGKIAYLPFQVEALHRRRRRAVPDHPDRRRATSAPPFGAGCEITHWNGMPIARAVAVNGDRFAGSNTAAHLARGLDSLTIRSLRIQPAAGRGVGDRQLPRSSTASARSCGSRGWWPTNLPPMTDTGRGHHGGGVDGPGPARRRDRPAPGAALRPAASSS